jgi:TatD DNase family protein
MNLVDTHCHLDFKIFADDREDVLLRAGQAGVHWMINPGVDLPSSQAAVDLARAHPQLRAAVGIHPNEANHWNPALTAQFEALARQPEVAAVGEIGLDYYRDRVEPAQQIAALRAQLALAARLDLPVIIHNRQADRDALPILAEWADGLRAAGAARAGCPGVFHSFDGSLAFARQVVAAGFLIGVTGPVTFRGAVQRQEVIAALPLENLLLETDAPFLTPHPLRGRRNEPANVRLIAEHIAALHSVSYEMVCNITSQNAIRLFALGE